MGYILVRVANLICVFFKRKNFLIKDNISAVKNLSGLQIIQFVAFVAKGITKKYTSFGPEIKFI